MQRPARSHSRIPNLYEIITFFFKNRYIDARENLYRSFCVEVMLMTEESGLLANHQYLAWIDPAHNTRIEGHVLPVNYVRICRNRSVASRDVHVVHYTNQSLCSTEVCLESTYTILMPMRHQRFCHYVKQNLVKTV